ncbi:MAG: hypothetical protein ABI972_05930 [Acidobacteriota bacterium]
MQRYFLLTFVSAFGLWSQQTPPAAPNTVVGLTTEWDIQKTVHAVGTHAARLIPLLEDVHPDEWVAKGAPDAYIGQLQSLKAELGYAARNASELGHEAADLGKAFELFMRLDASRSMYRSVVQGVRTYQNPALADLLESVELEGDAPRSRFRNYLVELASMKEKELKIIDQEAQRCRGQLIRQPAARPPAPKPKPPEPKPPEATPPAKTAAPVPPPKGANP